MHQCLKCGRTVSTLSEIEEGCACGSKVFVFTRYGSAIPSSAGANGSLSPAGGISANEKSPAFAGADGTSAPSATKPAASASISKKSGLTFLPSIQNVLGETRQKRNGVIIEPAPKTVQPALKTNDEKPSPAPLIPKETASHLPPSSVVASAPIPFELEESEIDTTPHQEVWLTKGGRISAIGSMDGSTPAGAPARGGPSDASAPAVDGSAHAGASAPAAQSGAPSPNSPTVSDSSIENIRQLQRGVYEVNVTSLREGPVVVRDSEGIYYVRLPFAQLPDVLTRNEKDGKKIEK